MIDNPELPIWEREGRYRLGSYSFAALRQVGNDRVNCFSQVDLSPAAAFAGIYDQHGGSSASAHVYETLIPTIMKAATNKDRPSIINESVIEEALREVEEKLIESMRQKHDSASGAGDACRDGCCVLLMIIYSNFMFFGSVGDGRAVIGEDIKTKGKVFKNITKKEITPFQVTKVRNINDATVRSDLSRKWDNVDILHCHPDGIWRLYGDVKTTHTIGDLILKDSQIAKSHNIGHIKEPILSAEPDTLAMSITPNHRFVILASSSFWNYISNQDAIDIVVHNPPQGIAKKLIQNAIKVATKKNENLELLPLKSITVMVFFIDQDMVEKRESLDISTVGAFRNAENESLFMDLYGFKVTTVEHVPDTQGASTSAPPVHETEGASSSAPSLLDSEDPIASQTSWKGKDKAT